MTTVGARLKLRVFLEGVELPIVAAVINSQKNAAASATLQLPANDYLLDLRPRTLVHLYCYDGYRGAPPEEQVWVHGEGISIKQKLSRDPDIGPKVPIIGAPTLNRELTKIDLENENYKLIFGGEVVGVSYAKSPASRQMSLQCVDWSSYWDIAYQYMVSGMSLGGGDINSAFTGASATVFNEFLKHSGDIVSELINSPPKSYPNLKGSLLGGIMHLLEAIGGCYYGSKAVRGTNDFFSLAEMRLHLTQMVAANPFSLQTESRLLNANGFNTLFGKTLGGLGKLVTIRQILLALQRYIFHEIVPITAPRFLPAEGNPGQAQAETVPLGSDSETAALIKAADLQRQRALELIGRQEQSSNAQLAKAHSNDRGGLKKELGEMQKLARQAYAKAKQVHVSAKVSVAGGGLQEVMASFETASRQWQDALDLCQSPRGYVLPLVGSEQAARTKTTFEAIAASMQKVLEAKYSRLAKRASHQPDPPARLFTQVYRPDVWMVAPPRCNVLFPELYGSFSYGRNFLNEVSRMLLRTSSQFWGSDVFFDGFYMAPSRLLGARKGKPIGQGRVNQAPDMTDAPAHVLKDMMDHELFTGIVPAFERMTDLNLHAIRGGSIEINGARVGFAQLACNHIFFGYRFRARDLMASGRFNPYAVLGFPMVIIDKYLSDNQLLAEYDSLLAEKLAKSFENNLPATERTNIVHVTPLETSKLIAEIEAQRPNIHYLGTPELISHSVSCTSGGSTQYQMSYARTTHEKTEFFGDNMAKASKAKWKKNVKVPTVVAAPKPPEVGTRGIRGGKIIEVKDVTDRYKKAMPRRSSSMSAYRFSSSTTLPLFLSDRTYTGRKQTSSRVPVGVTLPASAYGSEVMAWVNSGGSTITADGNVEVTFRAFQMMEELGSYVAEDVPLPPEDLAFPPWYGEEYRTNRIGALYSYFFGVGAITDPTVILGSTNQRQAIGTINEDNEKRVMRLALQMAYGAQIPTDMPLPGLSDTVATESDGVIGPPGSEGDTVLGEVTPKSPVADAVAEIVRIYSLVRSQHYDTGSFVHNYTWRPIASMVDLFGTADLSLNEHGVVTAGREGFHSRSFGAHDDLRNLVGPDETGRPQKVLGLEASPSVLSGKVVDPSAKIASRLDTRKEKQVAVLRYLNALSASRGVILG